MRHPHAALTRRRLAAAASACLLLALPACGGDEPPAQGAPGGATSGPTGTPPASASPGATTGAPAAPGTTGSSARASAGSDAGSGTSAAPRRTTASLPPGTGPADARQATAPGDYAYDVSGTVTVGAAPQPVDGTSTLTVDPAQGSAQHSVLRGDHGETEQDVLLRSNGTYLVRLRISSPAFDKTVQLDPAEVLVPAPATVGKTWSWTARSTDGKTTISQSSRVVRRETVSVGGKAVPCQVVMTTLTLRGDITYDGQLTTWYSEAFKLTAKERTQGKGEVQGFAFATDLTSQLLSTSPA